MNNDQPGGPLKVPIGETPQRPGATAPEQDAKAPAAQAERRLQQATGAVKEAFRNSRHT
jgi:hypothetical protein